ncbi:unnamed protein product [Arabidopsis halleri]
MSDEFQIGDYDAESAETLGNQTGIETLNPPRLEQFEMSWENMTEYIPCSEMRWSKFGFIKRMPNSSFLVVVVLSFDI